jgi:hypothetical protein
VNLNVNTVILTTVKLLFGKGMGFITLANTVDGEDFAITTIPTTDNNVNRVHRSPLVDGTSYPSAYSIGDSRATVKDNSRNFSGKLGLPPEGYLRRNVMMMRKRIILPMIARMVRIMGVTLQHMAGETFTAIVSIPFTTGGRTREAAAT